MIEALVAVALAYGAAYVAAAAAAPAFFMRQMTIERDWLRFLAAGLALATWAAAPLWMVTLHMEPDHRAVLCIFAAFAGFFGLTPAIERLAAASTKRTF
jgi:hypothetical protein